MPFDVQFFVDSEGVGVLQFFEAEFSSLLGFETHKGEEFVVGVFVLFDDGRLDFSEGGTDFVQRFFDLLFGVLRVLGLVWQVFDVQIFSGLLPVSFLLKDLGGNDLIFDLEVHGSLDTFGGGFNSVELDVPVSSGFSVGVVAHD